MVVDPVGADGGMKEKARRGTVLLDLGWQFIAQREGTPWASIYLTASEELVRDDGF